ncbi:MAG: hypothetical protein ACI84K_001516 [Pseudohongiellaceae bacterium]|jgi:hypothetical protein
MTDRTLWVGLIIFSSLITVILYVAFGQLSVRKLRKNPATKAFLGIELASGWDIINVAQALSLPKAWRLKLKNSSLSSIYANSDVLFEHTNKFDRILGTVFYWFLMISGLSGCLLVLLNALGFFQD